MKKYAVIVAGGSGTRMGGGMPKQFRSLCGRPVLWWSMKAFHEEDPDTRIIIVLPHDFIDLWKDFFSTLPEHERFSFEAVEGGKSRTESVKNGLSLINDDNSLVAIHDGARPLVSQEIISSGWKFAKEFGNGIPMIPLSDSLRKKTGDVSTVSVDRNDYLIVQTPQVFKVHLIKEAYKLAGKECFTDDATVLEHAGHIIRNFEGSPENIKITNPTDMALAAIMMGKHA